MSTIFRIVAGVIAAESAAYLVFVISLDAGRFRWDTIPLDVPWLPAIVFGARRSIAGGSGRRRAAGWVVTLAAPALSAAWLAWLYWDAPQFDVNWALMLVCGVWANAATAGFYGLVFDRPRRPARLPDDEDAE